MAHYSFGYRPPSMEAARDEGHVIYSTITGERMTKYNVDAAAIPGAYVRHDGYIAVKDPKRAQELVDAMNAGERLPRPGDRKCCPSNNYYFGDRCTCYGCTGPS